jgi:hypothetical protein
VPLVEALLKSLRLWVQLLRNVLKQLVSRKLFSIAVATCTTVVSLRLLKPLVKQVWSSDDEYTKQPQSQSAFGWTWRRKSAPR